MNKQAFFSIKSQEEFDALALDVFQYQAVNCAVYRSFITALSIQAGQIKHPGEIPFLPIEFFKKHKVISGSDSEEIIFYSSGTGGQFTSRHFVTELALYRESFLQAFNHFYGDIQKYAFLALLPSYLEREGSSLIFMVDELIKRSDKEVSGYFLHDHQRLYDTLHDLKREKTPTFLLGVSYALLDFVENHQIDFPELIVMETGGMKGKRKEIIKPELHSRLCQGFNTPAIHAEYGMTELLSQAYSFGKGAYRCPPWMRVSIRDLNDPFSLLPTGTTGGVNVIDLANLNSCSFLATQDLGKLHRNGTFEILGRFDNSDIRGCNLMVD